MKQPSEGFGGLSQRNAASTPIHETFVAPRATFGHNARPMSKRRPFTDQDALDFHSQGKPGKLEIIASKPMTTQRNRASARFIRALTGEVPASIELKSNSEGSESP